MEHPAHASRRPKSLRRLDAGEQPTQSQSNDLGLFEPGHSSQFSENLNIGFVESNGGYDNRAPSHPDRLAIPAEPRNAVNHAIERLAYKRNPNATQPLSPEGTLTNNSRQFDVNDPLHAKALPLGWLLNPDKDREDLTNRVLARLVQAEAHEVDPHYRDDIRVAWQVVHICQTGEAVMCSPAVLAWYKVFGCHPDHVWPRLVVRRKALIGNPDFMPSTRRKRAVESTGAEPPQTHKRSAPAPISRKDKLA